MPAPSELIANGRNEKQIEKALGADRLIYQNLSDLIEACQEGNRGITRFDTSCFSNEYVTGVEDGYLEELQDKRSDQAKLENHQNAGA
jgi:amidophosphoribosyltransferase